jgi:hypothetical protein
MTVPNLIAIYDEHGQRLYTMGQLAALTGRKYGTIRQYHRRGTGGLGEPAGWVDERTPVWHKPVDGSPLWTRDPSAPTS